MSEQSGVRFDVVDESGRALVAPGTQLREIAGGGTWFEGPVWLGETLVWSDVREGRLHAWDRDRGARVWIERAFHQNGHALDSAGRIVAASHGERAIVRREHSGRWTVLADFVDWKRFNSPNDLAIASDDSIWFTDPTYGLKQPLESFEPAGVSEIGGAHIYRVDPRGLSHPVICLTERMPAMPAPNGIAFNPEESILYVSDSEAGHILGFRIRVSLDGPELHQRWLVHETLEGKPDGIRVDQTGRIWSSSGAGVEILSPARPGERARHLATIRVLQGATNLAFAPDLTRLAITSPTSVFLVKLGDIRL